MCVPRAVSHTGHFASLVHLPDTDTLVLGMGRVRTGAGLGFPTWKQGLHTSGYLTLAQLANSHPFRNTSRANTMSGMKWGEAS